MGSGRRRVGIGKALTPAELAKERETADRTLRRLGFRPAVWESGDGKVWVEEVRACSPIFTVQGAETDEETSDAAGLRDAVARAGNGKREEVDRGEH